MILRFKEYLNNIELRELVDDKTNEVIVIIGLPKNTSENKWEEISNMYTLPPPEEPVDEPIE